MRDVKRSKTIEESISDDTAPALILKPVLAEPQAVKPKNISPKSAMVLSYALDGETARRLKTKIARPQARLDLHGMTEASAYKALTRFIAACVKDGQHLTLIITGKGRQGDGILRRNLPLWLETPALRRHVIAIAPAFAGDGG